MTLLSFVLTLTPLNLPLGIRCGYPTIQCEGQAGKACRGLCRPAHCEGYYFDTDYCEHGTCHEIWVYFCDDASWEWYECISVAVCPK